MGEFCVILQGLQDTSKILDNALAALASADRTPPAQYNNLKDAFQRFSDNWKGFVNEFSEKVGLFTALPNGGRVLKGLKDFRSSVENLINTVNPKVPGPGLNVTNLLNGLDLAIEAYNGIIDLGGEAPTA